MMLRADVSAFSEQTRRRYPPQRCSEGGTGFLSSLISTRCDVFSTICLHLHNMTRVARLLYKRFGYRRYFRAGSPIKGLDGVTNLRADPSIRGLDTPAIRGAVILPIDYEFRSTFLCI